MFVCIKETTFYTRRCISHLELGRLVVACFGSVPIAFRGDEQEGLTCSELFDFVSFLYTNNVPLSSLHPSNTKAWPQCWPLCLAPWFFLWKAPPPQERTPTEWKLKFVPHSVLTGAKKGFQTWGGFLQPGSFFVLILAIRRSLLPTPIAL